MTEATEACDWCPETHRLKKVLMRGVPGVGGIYVRACPTHSHLLPMPAIKGKQARARVNG